MIPVSEDAGLAYGVAPDLLHAEMRTGERMMNNTVAASVKHTGDKFARNLESLVQGLKVPFRIFEKPVHNKAQICISPMTGRNWKKVLAGMGPALRQSTNILGDEVKSKFVFLFEGLHDILSFAAVCSSADSEELARRCAIWGQAYASMGFTVTPYIHLIVFHVPKSVACLDRWES